MNFKSFLRYLGGRDPRQTFTRKRKTPVRRAAIRLEQLESRELLSVAPPKIVKVIPPDNSSTFSAHPQIAVTFSEPMNLGEVTNASNYLLFAGTGSQVTVDQPVSYDSSTNTASISYNGGNDLTAGTYTLFVRGDQLHDAVNDLPIAQPGQIIVANNGTQNISVVNMPGNGALQAISNYQSPAASNFAFTPTPAVVALADVNGDKIPDLLVANNSANTVSIFQGLPSGGFSTVPTTTLALPSGANPSGIAVGDFANNGSNDIAVSDRGTSQITVFLNNGSGAFPSVQNYAVPSPVGLVAADLDGDGRLDLAAAEGSSSNVDVLIGTGTGVFNGATPFATGQINLTGIAAGNLHLNAKQIDLVVSSGTGTQVMTNRTTTPGQPQFVQGAVLGTQPTTSVAVGDLNKDTRPDVAATTNQNNGAVLVFINGLAGFSNGVPFAANPNPVAVAIGDVNADGENDLLVANDTTGSPAPSTMSVLVNQGGTSFAAPVAYKVDAGPVGLAIHADAQNKVDLVVTANGTGNDVSLLRNNGDGTFGVSTDTPVTRLTADAVLSTDLNGDNVPDFVVANFNTNTVQVFLRNANGSLGNPTTYTVGSGPVSLAAADLTKTGKIDLIVVNQNDNTVQVLANDGTGMFVPQAPIQTGKHPTGVVVGDFNGDGNIDMAVSHNGNGGPLLTDQGVTVFISRGNRTFFTPSEYLPGTNAVAIAAGDFDANGRVDLAVVDGAAAGTVTILHGVGDGTFTTSSADVYAAGENPNSIAVGDLNGDRRPDIVVTNQSIPAAGSNPTAYISVLLNTPGIGFSGAIRTNVVTDPNAQLQTVAIANVNQDLYPDIVASVADRSGTPNVINNLVTLQGLGDGTFLKPQFFATFGGGPNVPPSFMAVASDPLIRATTFQVLSTTVQTNLILNGTFDVLDLAAEKGNLDGWQQAAEPSTTAQNGQPNYTSNAHGSWNIQTGTLSPLSQVPVASPPQGQYAAMLDEQNYALPFSSALGVASAHVATAADYEGAHIFYQDFAIPATSSKVTLTFQLYINNTDNTNTIGYSDPNVTPQLDYFPNQPGAPVNQQVRVDIVDPNVPNTSPFDVNPVSAGGIVLKNVYITSPSTPALVNYITVTADLTQFKGKSVRLRFGEANNRGKLLVGTDNVRVEATFPDLEAPTITNIHLRNPGIDSTTLFGGKSTDTTIIGRVGDNGSANNIAFVAVSPTNDGTFTGPGDFKVARLDALGNFAVTVPFTLPGQYTIGIEAVDDAGNATATTFTFTFQGPSLTTFQAEGPGPIRFIGKGIAYKTVSGTITTTVADPSDPTGNSVYVGTDNGGVWKTVDGGQDWTPLTDYVTDPKVGAISIAVGAIAIDPNQTDTVYVGTGVPDAASTSQPGIGILKSTDAGKTWTLLANDIFNGARISKIVIGDKNPQTNLPGLIFVAVVSGGKFGPGLYSSADTGGTWQIALNPATMNLDAGGTLGAGHALASVTDFDIDRLSSNEEVLYVGLGNIGLAPTDTASAGLWKTTNAGGNWFQQAGGHNTKGGAVLHQLLPIGSSANYDVGLVKIALPGDTEVLGPDGRLHPSNRPGIPGIPEAGDEGVVYVFMQNRLAVVVDDGTASNFDKVTGLFKSIDGGQSWTHVMLRQNAPAINPSTPIHNYEDLVIFGGSADVNFGSIAVDPTDAKVLYIGGSNRFLPPDPELPLDTPLGEVSHALLRIDTTNMRDTSYFDFITNNYPNEGDDIYKRIDAELLQSPPSFPGRYPNGDAYTGEGVFWYDLQMQVSGRSDYSHLQMPGVVRGISFDSQARLLVGTEGGIWRGVSQGYAYDSTSGGSFSPTPKTWGIESDLGVQTPREPGMVFTDLNGNLQITDQLSVAIDPNNNHVLDTANYNLGWAQTNGTLQWQSTNDVQATIANPGPPIAADPFVSPAPFAGIVRAGPRNPTQPQNPTVIYRTYANILLNNPPDQFEVSVKGGNQGSFTSVTQGLDLTGLAVYPNFAVNPIQINETGTPQSELLFAGNKVFETDDGAASWQQTSTVLAAGDPITALAFGTGGDDVFYVGTQRGKVFVTLNNGADGFPLRNTGLPAQTIGGIVVDPTNFVNAFTALGGFGTGVGHLFHTTDGGKTWTNITGNLPDVPAYAVALDPRPTPGAPAGHLWVGTQVGVFVSTNLGAKWTLLGEGLPHVPVVDLQFDSTEEKLVAATLGRGTWQINTDIHGPQVISVNPMVPILPGMSSVTITFNKPVDPRTFTTAQVRELRGPNGPITPLSVQDMDPVNHEVYQINFVTQTSDGIYTVTIGPNITDFVGNAMDQNNNGVNGEDPGDRFTFNVAINTTDDGRFVTGSYHDLLNRPADTNGFLSMIAGVDSARFQLLAANALGIVSSDEARADEISSTNPSLTHPPAFPFYQSLLNRTPSAAEVSSWVAGMKNGLTEEGVIIGLAGSDEYFVNAAGGDDTTFVKSLYTKLLGRAADAGGLNGYLQFLASAEASSRQGLANGLINGSEYTSTLVSGYYQTYLKRGASPAEVAPWVSAIQSGVRNEQVIANLLGSPEYFQNRAGSDNAKWINTVYLDLLNRPVDPAGQASWLAQLNSGVSRTAVALSIATSQEYFNNLVQGFFTKYLARVPSQAEINVFVKQLQQGATDQGIITTMVASAEYVKLHQGAVTTQAGLDASWTNAVFNDLLNRSPNSTEQANFMQTLAAAERTAHGIVVGRFVGNDEYRTDLIVQTYQTYLGRAAGASDINIWLPLLRQPGGGPGTASPDEQFFANIVGSGEFFFDQIDPANQLHTNNQWMTALYRDFLGRTPSATELTAAVNGLLNGYQSQRQGEATALDTSTEYRRNLIIRLFSTYLRRTPSPDEIAGRLAQLNAGVSDEGLINDMISSQEYFQNPKGKGGAGDNSVWLNQVYLDVLGRGTSNDPGAQNFLDLLNQGKITRAQIGAILLSSDEYRGRVIIGIYQTFLGRTPAGSEIAGWLMSLRNGVKDEQVIAAVMSSPEYFQRQLTPARLAINFP